MIAPLRHLPRTIDDRLTGATSSSHRKPSSRSHTSEAAVKIDVNSTVMPRTPGKMNVFRSTPPVEAADSDCRPEPSTNRNSSGWISAMAICMRLPAKRIRSRRQMVFTARSSERHERSATRTATTSATIAPPAGAAEGPCAVVGETRGPHRLAPAIARIRARV